MPRSTPPGYALIVLSLACTLAASAQTDAVRRDIGKFYAQNCAACHGRNLQGGLAPSLLDDQWLHGDRDEDIARVIRDGVNDAMDGYRDELSEADIRAMVIFIREKRAGFSSSESRPARPQPTEPIASERHRFKLETVADRLSTPWGMAFLPDGRLLFTEKSGQLRVIERGVLRPEPIRGTPAVRDAGQGGLLEVAVHPRYAENGWIYLAYSDPATRNGEPVSLTTLVRGKLRDGAWVEQQTIWRAPLEFYRPGGGVHFGCRIVFDRDGYLFFSHGERGRQENAQDLKLPNGKIHRLHDDGRIPEDNPFAKQPGAFASIWTYGNRNPQGLALDPRDGSLWETEHGPRGGDELNLIRRGANYGWPVITYGMNYNGTPITATTAKDGMEQPVTHWTPSIAVCGIDFYTGDKFPGWKHNLLVTALAQQELRRVVIDGGKVTHQEILLKDFGRVRDVQTGPDGTIYVALNQPDRIVRLVPTQ
ncbi:MAG: PQQ-dependent sugar dehydrogenase [Opitutae bacterium]|nr:PQQ-dependent sugar dehydrogenase [Opitutae bacterium]